MSVYKSISTGLGAICAALILSGCSLISSSNVDTGAQPISPTVVEIEATPISGDGSAQSADDIPAEGEEIAELDFTTGTSEGESLENLDTADADTTSDQNADTSDTSGTSDTTADADPTPIVIPTTAATDSSGSQDSKEEVKPSPIPLQTPTPSAILLTTAFTNASKVTTVGIDEVFFGMLAEEAAQAASTKWDLIDGSAKGTCYQVTPNTGPDGVVLWVVDGHMERVDVSHPDIRTPSSYGVGTALTDLQNHLGSQLTVETVTSEQGTQFQQATFTPTDSGDAHFRIVFDIEDGVVKRYRSGRVGIVERLSC